MKPSLPVLTFTTGETIYETESDIASVLLADRESRSFVKPIYQLTPFFYITGEIAIETEDVSASVFLTKDRLPR